MAPQPVILSEAEGSPCRIAPLPQKKYWIAFSIN